MARKGSKHRQKARELRKRKKRKSGARAASETRVSHRNPRRGAVHHEEKPPDPLSAETASEGLQSDHPNQ